MAPILLVAAALPTVLGFQLGAPVPLPECERMVLTYPHADGSPGPYTSLQPRQCVQYDPDKATAKQGMIYFPPQTVPAIASFNWAGIHFMAGRLEAISISTLDHNQSDYVVAQLTAKFGKPSLDQPDETVIQHIAVPSRTVVWKRPEFRVEYHSVDPDLDRGLVQIMTTAYEAGQVVQDAAEQKARTPL